jgi:superfamily II DNA/RNA helicase
MQLKPDLLKGIYAYGFEKPSAIRQRAIRPIIRGRDVIAQSQSGTEARPAVFSVSALQLLDGSSRDVQVLISQSDSRIGRTDKESGRRH